jgi:hypothetical protein
MIRIPPIFALEERRERHPQPAEAPDRGRYGEAQRAEQDHVVEPHSGLPLLIGSRRQLGDFLRHDLAQPRLLLRRKNRHATRSTRAEVEFLLAGKGGRAAGGATYSAMNLRTRCSVSGHTRRPWRSCLTKWRSLSASWLNVVAAMP